MSDTLGLDLWDKIDVVLGYNENNSIVVDRLQRAIVEFCKNLLNNSAIQKRLFEKFMSENDALKKSMFNFSTHTYFLTEQIYDIINAQETFGNSLLNEADDVIKSKSYHIKKDSRLLKNEKKKLFDDISKESQKLECDMKKYQNRYIAQDNAYISSIQAEDNKALSRNQVDCIQNVYVTKKSQYEESRSEYRTTLNHFNDYQSKHYKHLLPEWGLRACKIENERYLILKATLTNVAELCKSMSSKFHEIAERIESRIDMIDYEKDCITLINQEKTGDVPPQDVPFKDLEIVENIEVSMPGTRMSKISNSGSDSTSSHSGNKKNSNTWTHIKTRSVARSSTAISRAENGPAVNGTAKSNRLFGRLFGGSKKIKESPTQNTESEVERLESLLEEKGAQNSEHENSGAIDQEITDAKNSLDSCKNDYSGPKKPDSRRKISLFQSMRQKSWNKSVDETDNFSKISSKFDKRCRRSLHSQYDRGRSQSASSLAVRAEEETKCKDDTGDKIVKNLLKPKTGHKPLSKSKKGIENNKDRASTIRGIHSRSIEVVRNSGPIEIVSTPAEALAIAARSSYVSTSAHTASPDIGAQSISEADMLPVKPKRTYTYFYVGSCVAVHKYESTDESSVYLSFEVGEQFYTIREEVANKNNGWLLVERIDRSQCGYVPASYMDTRQFDTEVPMSSDHPMVVSP